MTIKEILKAVKPHKRMSREMLYVHLRELKIKPIGVRQSPQRYPDDAAVLILKRIGALRLNGNGHSNGKGRK